MHHLRTLYEIRRFRLAAILLSDNYLFAPGAAGLLVHSLLTSSRKGVMFGGVLMVTSLICVVVQWAVASRANCPLCMTSVLAPRACVKNRRARSLFGSHRLRVALEILCTNRFRCQYCNESTVMAVRESPTAGHQKKHLRQCRRCP